MAVMSLVKDLFFLQSKLRKYIKSAYKMAQQSTHEVYNYGQKASKERKGEQIPTTLTTTKSLHPKDWERKENTLEDC